MKATSTIAPSTFQSAPKSKEQQEQTIQLIQPSASLIELLESNKTPNFALFKLNQPISTYVIPYVIIQTIFILARWSFALRDEGVPLASKLVLHVMLLVPLIEWAYIYLIRRHVYSDTLTAAGERIILLGNLAILLQALSLGAMLLVWILTRDDCHSDHYCRQDHPKQMLPARILVINIVGVIGLPVLFPCHDARVSLFTAFIAGSAMFASAVLLHLELPNILSVIFGGMSAFTIMFCYEGMIFSAYTSYLKFETALRVNISSENKEFLLKIQTEEMRHMIGTCDRLVYD